MRPHVLFFCILCMTSFILKAEQSAISPEMLTGIQLKPLVKGKHQMVVTNNPWASKTADDILNQGGNAIDAAIAAAFVLGLTEPQSSGIGGGGFALTYQAANHLLRAYDGREIAPKSAPSDLFIDAKGKPMDFLHAVLSYRAIGVPSEVDLLSTMHQKAGKLPWRRLLQPAIDLATKGFPLSLRLYKLLTVDQQILIQDPAVKAIYFTKKGKVKPLGTAIINKAYAQSLQIIAKNPRAFYTGSIGADIINKVNQLAGYGVFSRNDLTGYKTQESTALCSSFRRYTICTTPFESGGVSVLELLRIYENAYSPTKSDHIDWIYYFLQASKLAFADRNQYIADPHFVSISLAGLLDKNYIQQRSQLISNVPLRTPIRAGIPLGADPTYSPDDTTQEKGTTALAIVDKEGNAISLTVTIEHAFGSHQFVDGFFLNNELTDFSFNPTDKKGHQIANRVEPLKRPRSAIAPTMVFNQQAALVMLSGSPGGAPIICYVAKNLIQMIDFNRTPKDSSTSGNLCALNDIPIMEQNSDLIGLIPKLEKKGEQIIIKDDLVSGAVNIKKSPQGWLGAADPRREGVAIGR